MSLHGTRSGDRFSALPADAVAEPFRIRPAFGVGLEPVWRNHPMVNGTDLQSHGAVPRRPGRVADLDRWLADVSSVRESAGIDDAILAALELVDALIEAGEVQRCAELLSHAKPEELPTEVLIALLSATLPFRDQLVEARSTFYERVAKTLRVRAPQEVDALLDGLQ